MLNSLRKGSKGILAKLLIALLVFAFAIWGISDFVNQVDPSEVARAGDTPVSSREFDRVYRQALGNTSRQMGRGLTPQEAQAVGLPRQVLSQLVTEAFQVDAARDLGVDLSDEALAERIRTQPAFAAPNGTFDRIRFDQLLADNRYSEAEFIEIQRDAARQEILVGSLLGGFDAPKIYLEAFNRYQNQTRRVRHMTLTDAALGPIEDPSEDDLRAYYDANKAIFRAPEYRTFGVVSLSADALADPAAVSDDAIRRAYDAPGAYGDPERRGVQQIIMDDAAAAEAAAERVNAGTPFETVLTDLSRTFADVDLGAVTRDEVLDPAVAEAAFSMEAGRAAAVDGRFGAILVHVSEVTPAGKRPFEEVADEIRTTLAQEDAQGELRNIFNEVEDAVAGGAQVSEIAERFDLPSRSVEKISEAGGLASGTTPEPPVEGALITAAYQQSVGDDAEPVEVGETTHWVQLTDITEAADRPYEEVADAVLLAWVESEKVSRLGALAEEALSKIDNGVPMAEVAQQYGVSVGETEPFSQGAITTELPQPVPAAAFEGPRGHTASVIAENGDHVIIKVTEVAEPAFFEADADLQQARSVLNRGIADGLLYEFVNAWQAEHGATVNQPVIDQLIGLTPYPGQHRGM
ncbi:MAG: SurA N-terminal domain-containing protein [Pseudomonadota bacterium]